MSARKGTQKKSPSLADLYGDGRAIRAILDEQSNRYDGHITVCSQQAAYLPCCRVEEAFQTADPRDVTANVGRKKAKFAHYFLVISDDTALPKYSASSMIKMISAIIK